MFILLIGVPCALAHVYLWLRLVRDTTRPGHRGRCWGAAALAFAFVVMLAAIVASRDLPPALTAILAWPGYLWLALMFYLTLVLGVLEIPRLVVTRRTRRPRHADVASFASAPVREPVLEPQSAAAGGPAGVDTRVDAGDAGGSTPGVHSGPGRGVPASRRVFIARSFALAGSLGAGAIVGHGVANALGTPEVRTVPVTLSKLDPALAGFRIAVVSDIHLGPLLGRGHTERIVRLINEARPDLVAIVGDLVDGTVRNLGEAAAPLRDLASRHGSYFVTGNHEYFSGAEPWLREMERLGVHPLRNERVAVERGGAAFDLAGVNDVTGRAAGDPPDLARALAGRDASRPVVLMAHQPVQVEEAALRGVDLQLSGHTHGGQMFPFHLAIALQQPATAGLAKIDNTWLYVTRGVGFWGPPVRVGAPPDISIMELR